MLYMWGFLLYKRFLLLTNNKRCVIMYLKSCSGIDDIKGKWLGSVQLHFLIGEPILSIFIAYADGDVVKLTPRTISNKEFKIDKGREKD